MGGLGTRSWLRDSEGIHITCIAPNAASRSCLSMPEGRDRGACAGLRASPELRCCVVLRSAQGQCVARGLKRLDCSHGRGPEHAGALALVGVTRQAQLSTSRAQLGPAGHQHAQQAQRDRLFVRCDRPRGKGGARGCRSAGERRRAQRDPGARQGQQQPEPNFGFALACRCSRAARLGLRSTGLWLAIAGAPGRMP